MLFTGFLIKVNQIEIDVFVGKKTPPIQGGDFRGGLKTG